MSHHDDLADKRGDTDEFRTLTATIRPELNCTRCRCPAEAHEHYGDRWHCSLCQCPMYYRRSRLVQWLQDLEPWQVGVPLAISCAGWAVTDLLIFTDTSVGRPEPPWAHWTVALFAGTYIALTAATVAVRRLIRKLRERHASKG